MHFYVDESGHTGLNLFDAEQPLLYYGCLSSHLSLDHEAVDRLEHMRAKVGASRLHANQLGNGGLAVIAQDLADLQRSFGLRFSVYRVAKPDHAIICFFDQVFDSAMNPACRRRSKSEPPCRPNIEPGVGAGLQRAGGG